MKASSLGFKQIVIRYEMFRYEVECIIGPRKNVAKYVSYSLNDEGNRAAYEPTDSCRGKFYFGKHRAPIIWLPRFPRDEKDYGTLAHEVSHAVMDMLKYVGCEFSADGDETFCYAVDFGVTKILEAKRGR